jgi:hypothetical protein
VCIQHNELPKDVVLTTMLSNCSVFIRPARVQRSVVYGNGDCY